MALVIGGADLALPQRLQVVSVVNNLICSARRLALHHWPEGPTRTTSYALGLFFVPSTVASGAGETATAQIATARVASGGASCHWARKT